MVDKFCSDCVLAKLQCLLNVARPEVDCNKMFVMIVCEQNYNANVMLMRQEWKWTATKFAMIAY